MFMGLRRHRKGSCLCRRCALPEKIRRASARLYTLQNAIHCAIAVHLHIEHTTGSVTAALGSGVLGEALLLWTRNRSMFVYGVSRLLRTEGELDHHQETPPCARSQLLIITLQGRAVGYAGTTSLWHGPGGVSVVPDYRAPGAPMAGQRPRRPRRPRQPRALGLGGATPDAAGGQPVGRPRGAVGRNQPAFPDIGGYGNHEYGNRVGLFRLLAVLDKYGITPTLALDRAGADHYRS